MNAINQIKQATALLKTMSVPGTETIKHGAALQTLETVIPEIENTENQLAKALEKLAASEQERAALVKRIVELTKEEDANED